jgi:hypothetical protein
VTGEHHPSCSHRNIDINVTCPPDAVQCCQVDHDHGAAANSCTADHSSEPCPEPKNCRTWKGAIADARHPLFEPGSHPLFSGTAIPDCPGGHCHKDLESCAGCRPLHIVMLPGTQVTLAGQAGG